MQHAPISFTVSNQHLNHSRFHKQSSDFCGVNSGQAMWNISSFMAHDIVALGRAVAADQLAADRLRD